MSYHDRYPQFQRGIYWFWEAWTVKDNTLPVPDKVMKHLGWDEKTLLEFKQTEDGWVIQQSKVAASKYVGTKTYVAKSRKV